MWSLRRLATPLDRRTDRWRGAGRNHPWL